jgi:hypothetical protein
MIADRALQGLCSTSCVDGSHIARLDSMFLRCGRVQSCVRPHMMRSHMTAGPDGIRGQGPILQFGL